MLGQAERARLANAFQPRGDIDAVAQNVVGLDHVAKMDADAIDDALGLGRAGVALDHQLLHRDGAYNGGDHGGEFEQQAVAHRLDDAIRAIQRHRAGRLDILPYRPHHTGLILAHQPGIASDVDSHDCSKTAGGGHSSGSPALRIPSRTRAVCAW